MMPLPGLQIHLQPSLMLTFDHLTCKVDNFMSLPRWSLVPTGINTGSLVFKTLCTQVWYQMNERAHGRVENVASSLRMS